MADMNASDVERHYRDLEKQLVEDGFDPESQVMKTTKRLLRALREDGFAFGGEVEREVPHEKKETAMADETESTQAEVEATAVPSPIIRAFRTRDEHDTAVITSVFAAIDGWRTKTIKHKGSHFVVATNGKWLTDNRVKQAIVDYVQELKQANLEGRG